MDFFITRSIDSVSQTRNRNLLDTLNALTCQIESIADSSPKPSPFSVNLTPLNKTFMELEISIGQEIHIPSILEQTTGMEPEKIASHGMNLESYMKDTSPTYIAEKRVSEEDQKVVDFVHGMFRLWKHTFYIKNSSTSPLMDQLDKISDLFLNLKISCFSEAQVWNRQKDAEEILDLISDWYK